MVLIYFILQITDSQKYNDPSGRGLTALNLLRCLSVAIPVAVGVCYCPQHPVVHIFRAIACHAGNVTVAPDNVADFAVPRIRYAVRIWRITVINNVVAAAIAFAQRVKSPDRIRQ